MSATKKRAMTEKLLREYIENYKAWSEEVAHYENEMAKLKPAGSTAKYGIEASMPRGSGNGHSDPTYIQATTKHVDDYIYRRMVAVREVEKRRRNIKSVYDSDILDMWINSMNNAQIGGVLNVTEITVSRYKKRILQMMMEG